MFLGQGPRPSAVGTVTADSLSLNYVLSSEKGLTAKCQRRDGYLIGNRLKDLNL